MARRISWLIISLLLAFTSCGDADMSTEDAAGLISAPSETTFAASSNVATTTAPPAPRVVWPVGGWPATAPEEQGMDSDELAVYVERFTAAGEIDSMTIIRNGYVVVDAVFYPFPPDTGHNLYSVTKSVVGTLIGIAIDRGFLGGVDVPVVEILTDAAPLVIDERRGSMTIEDLLTMTPGMDARDNWQYEWEGMTALTASDDWTAFALNRPMIAEPGSRFEYSNQASFLLSAIVSEVTGLAAAEFAEEALFGPLGIADYAWPASPDGITLGWSDLVLRPEDAAKLGYLYLRGGVWDGEQIVSPGWIEAATAEQIDLEGEPVGYGYQWWVYEPLGYAMAQGYGGQFVVVDQAHDLVLVFTSHAEAFSASGITNEIVLRALRSDEPLPPNPEGEQRLAEAVQRAREGPEPRDVELPARAAAVSGVTYAFRPNEVGLGSFRITFGDDVATIELSSESETVTSEIGLDRRFRLTEGEDFVTASRGSWSAVDVFVITFQHLGLATGGRLQLRFGDDHVNVRITTLEGTVAAVADRLR